MGLKEVALEEEKILAGVRAAEEVLVEMEMAVIGPEEGGLADEYLSTLRKRKSCGFNTQ